VFGVLARGDITDSEGVQYAIANAIGDDGGFSPPLVLTRDQAEIAVRIVDEALTEVEHQRQ